MGNNGSSRNSLPPLARLGYTARIVQEYIGDTILILASNKSNVHEASKACGGDGDLVAFQNDSINSLLITQQVLYSAILSHKNELALHMVASLSSLHMDYSAMYDATCISGNIEFIDAIYSGCDVQGKTLVIAQILKNAIIYNRYGIIKKYVGEIKQPTVEDLPLVQEVFKYAVRVGNLYIVKMMWETLDNCLTGTGIDRHNIATQEIYDYLTGYPRVFLLYDV